MKPKIKSCKACKEEFETVHKAQRFCNPFCREKFYYATKVKSRRKCSTCGAVYKTRSALYCSNACRTVGKRIARGEEPERVFERNCKSCGKTFMQVNPGQQYCSHPCSRTAARPVMYARRIGEVITRAELENALEEYLAKGGMIRQHKPGFAMYSVRNQYVELAEELLGVGDYE